MDAKAIDSLVRRLIADPHDEAAIQEAHRGGQQDPRGYAGLLEKVGAATADPALASHWLNEAASVWQTTLNDAHRAARALMMAIDREPTRPEAADRLAELYREKGDAKGLVALLERRAKALASDAGGNPEILAQLAGLHEELGQLWSGEQLDNVDKAIENYQRALGHDPRSQFSIYSLREIYKAKGNYLEAIPYFAQEQALVEDPDRRHALWQDEAEVRKTAGDLLGCAQVFELLLSERAEDPEVQQQLAAAILDVVRMREPIDESMKAAGAQLFVALAELYPGEHALAYSTCALEVVPGHDRAVQLAIHYGNELGRIEEVATFAAAYVQCNPNGVLADEAKAVAGAAAPFVHVDPADQTEIDLSPAHEAAAQSASAQQSEPEAVAMPEPAPEGAPETVAPPEEAGPTVEAAAKVPAVFDEETAAGEFDASELLEGEIVDEEPAPEPGSMAVLLEEAAQFLSKRRKNEAAGRYREVLALDPTQAAALAFLQTHLRQTRKYAELRDMLLVATRAPDVSAEARATWFREVASLCEAQLRDFASAISAWQQLLALEPGDEETVKRLKRLLERGGKWDELAVMFEQQAAQATDKEERIALEKDLAKLHEGRRKDPAAAGEAWARIANITPDDDTALNTAIRLFERGKRPDLAEAAISDNVTLVEDAAIKLVLYTKLGALREGAGALDRAAEAYAEGAAATSDLGLWEAAERCYAAGEDWANAASAIDERAQVASEDLEKANLFTVEADYLVRAGDENGATDRLQQASALDPLNDATAASLEQRLLEAGRFEDLVVRLLERASKLEDPGARVSYRRRAASIQREQLEDPSAARESLELVLADGEDPGALSELAEDSEANGDFAAAVELLARLGRATSHPVEAVDICIREARLRVESLSDLAGAIACYERVLAEYDPKNTDCFVALAELEEQQGDQAALAALLERHLQIVDDAEGKIELCQRLATLYETELDLPGNALRALRIVHELDPDDFDAVQRLLNLAEVAEEWDSVVLHTKELIEVEGDEEEISGMTRRCAEILHEKLEKHEEALNLLAAVGTQGDQACRDYFVEMGDEVDEKIRVATQLVEWFREFPSGKRRTTALHGAFERFAEAGKLEEAASVAKDLAHTRTLEANVAETLEGIAVELKDLDALAVAQRLLVKELGGPARSEELVRQAEVMISAGVEPVEAVEHAEQGISSTPPEEVEPLLVRLAALVKAPGHVIDVYERQVTRCKAPEDRLNALGRAAQIAADKDALDRAREFFDLAIQGGVQEETLAVLEAIAKETDQLSDNKKLRTTLAEALAGGGQGSRDGGRTRSALLLRAATIAHVELADVQKAFEWVGDALVTHVDDEGLQALDALGADADDYGKVEAVLARALEEVFDGPLVRKLLAARADVRLQHLDDMKGAAVDLKRLHDLTPGDAEVMGQLSSLYTELKDFRGMVALFEDQILRGRDQGARAELARQVALLWENELDDPREAADAWRRVLRMKSGDEQAKAGLDKAKADMLARKSELAERAAKEEAERIAAKEAEEKEAADQQAAAEQAEADGLAEAEHAAADAVDDDADPADDAPDEAETTDDEGASDADATDADATDAVSADGDEDSQDGGELPEGDVDAESTEVREESGPVEVVGSADASHELDVATNPPPPEESAVEGVGTAFETALSADDSTEPEEVVPEPTDDVVAEDDADDDGDDDDLGADVDDVMGSVPPPPASGGSRSTPPPPPPPPPASGMGALPPPAVPGSVRPPPPPPPTSSRGGLPPSTSSRGALPPPPPPTSSRGALPPPPPPTSSRGALPPPPPPPPPEAAEDELVDDSELMLEDD
ncbi:MAG: hypothetical protein HRU17_06975 [Polyangiaceae bacterium]|nr:hypothetical protein [Polyangiaceae bacterium]